MQDTIRNFLKVTDEAFEELSKMQEQKLSDIPSWILSNRNIKIAYASFTDSYLIIIFPDKTSSTDICSNVTIDTQEQLNEFVTAYLPGFKLEVNGGFMMLADMELRKVNEKGEKNLYLIPAYKFNGLIITGTEEIIKEALNDEDIKHGALNIWNSCLSGLDPNSGSFYEQLERIFDKFRCLIKRKSFLERRIHRY